MVYIKYSLEMNFTENKNKLPDDYFAVNFIDSASQQLLSHSCLLLLLILKSTGVHFF